MRNNYSIKLFFVCLLLGIAPLVFGQIQITSPVLRAVYQRNSSNQSIIYIGGNYTQKMDRIEARFVPVLPGQGAATNWTTIVVNPQGGNFVGAMTVSGGWYQLEVRGTLNGVQVGQVATLSRVGVGEVFVIAGQSNAQGIGIFDNTDFDYQAPASTDDRVNAFSYRNATNSVGDLPIPSFEPIGSRGLIAPRGETAWCWGKLGDLLVNRLNVPVVFFNAAWAATAIRNWRESAAGQTSFNIYNNSIAYPMGMPYGNLKISLQQYASQFGIRAVLWHQGETDSFPLTISPVNPTTQQNYVQDLQFVINKSRTDSGKDISWVVSKASLNFNGQDYVTSPAIINAQNQVINTTSNVFAGPSTDNIQVPRTDYALVHFWGQGLADVASAWSDALSLSFFSNSRPQLPTGVPLINVSCVGNGNLTLTLPQGYNSYVWSTGQTTPSISATPGASYYARVRDGLGNTVFTHTVTIPANAGASPPTITTDGSTTVCQGASVKLTSSSATDNVWSTGATSASITVSNAGSYTVTARNVYGCVATSAPITLTNFPTPPPVAPTVVSVGTTNFCQGGSTQLVSNFNGRTIWSTGAEGQSINVVAGGSYYARSVDAFGCSSQQSNTINVTVVPNPNKPVISRSGPSVFCGGGTVTLTSSYSSGNQWSNGSTAQAITVSTAGLYSVRYTNPIGCKSEESDPITVTINPIPPAPTVTPKTSTTFCQGESATLESSFGAAYFWSNGETTASIRATAAGNYTVFIIDNNGCQSPSSAPVSTTVNPLPAPPTIGSAGAPTTFCPGGKVSLSSSPGLGYLWSNGSTAEGITVSTSGIYTARLRDANGCLSIPSNPIVVNVLAPPATPTITASGATTFCEGGSVTLTSNPAVAYVWGTGASGRTINVSVSGNYSLLVKDGNGCESAPASVAVKVNPLPAKPVVSSSGVTTFCQGGTVTLTSVPSTAYRWTSGANTQGITINSTGRFAVEVIDENGCRSPLSDSVRVTVNPLPSKPVVTANGATTFCADKNVELVASSDNAYRWSTGATTQRITVNTAGSYTVQAVNTFGCNSVPSDPVITAVNPLPSAPLVSASNPVSFCRGGSATLCANAESPTWSTNEKLPCITVRESGTYTARVTDQNGCVSPPSAGIKVEALALPSKPSIEQIGTFTIEAVGAVVGDDYQWKYNGVVIPNTSARIIKATRSGSYDVSTRITYTAPAPLNQVVCLSEPSQKSISIPDVDMGVYPNPNDTGIFRVETREDLADANVRVYMLTGEVVHETKVQVFNERKIIDLSKLPGAPYILEIQTANFKGSKLIYIFK